MSQKASAFVPQPSVKAKLPELTLIFCIQAWGFILVLVAGIFSGCFNLFGQEFLPLRIMTFWRTLLPVFIALSLLYVWALVAVHTRSDSAPAACRLVMAVTIALALLAIAGLILVDDILFNVQYYLRSIYKLSNFFLLRYLLAIIVISAGWRLYFFESPKVRSTFHLQSLDNQSPVRPAEIGFFQIACYLMLIFSGGTSLEHIIFHFKWNNEISIYSALLVLQLAGFIALPLIALWLSRAGSKASWSLYILLGLWIGFCLASNFFAKATYVGGQWYFSGVSNAPISDFFTGRVLLALVFWWYFASSEKAQTWLNWKRQSA